MSVFTFGTDHVTDTGMSLFGYYTVIDGDYEQARKQMFEARGPKWAFQYETEEEAGVERFNLEFIPFEDIVLSEEDMVW